MTGRKGVYVMRMMGNALNRTLPQRYFEIEYAGKPIPENARYVFPYLIFMNHFLLSFLAGAALLVPIAASAAGVPPVTIQNVALTFDQAWEGSTSNYVTVFQDGPLYRMYYRGSEWGRQSVTCYAESKDGVTWTRPNLDLYSFSGSTNNNIVWMNLPSKYMSIKGYIPPGDYERSLNFAPFKDTNPNAKPDELYKAFDGAPPHAIASPDGIHWHLMQTEPIMGHDGA
jgi:hypothetical protein